MRRRREAGGARHDTYLAAVAGLPCPTRALELLLDGAREVGGRGVVWCGEGGRGDGVLELWQLGQLGQLGGQVRVAADALQGPLGTHGTGGW
jgi:hypothetical protein